jgi:hypothetical protein
LLLTKSEYARARGCSPAAVTTAIKDGRIRGAIVTRNGKELLDLDKANELWARNTQQQPPPRAKPAPVAPRPAAASPTDQELQAFIQGLPEDQIPDLNDSRARREHYLAEKARLDALRGRDELGPIADMQREAFALGKAVREGMLGIIPRISADLAAARDQFEVERLLEAEVLTALRVLTDG